MPGETNYNSWTKTGLIKRLREVEGELKRRTEAPQPVVGAASTHDETLPEDGAPDNKTPKGAQAKKRKMDPSRYSTRFIALKLAYLGKNYGGFEFQSMGNQPSIEEELWNALTKACLIFPEDERIVQFECCEYSKCGRTDRGVSAFGQVIGLRVRSNRPLPKKQVEVGGPVSEDISGEATQVEKKASSTAGAEEVAGEKETEAGEEQEEEEEEEEGVPFDDLKDELCYPRILNRLLPDDIRILAWCPSPPADFSARFSCRERQYRYFFTQPAFAPNPAEAAGPPSSSSYSSSSSSSSSSALQPGWLDIEAMRNAAKRFEGEHDFRNFCKVDPAKQISNFRRRIFESDIVQVQDASGVLPFLQNQQSPCGSSVEEGPYPQVYYFHVRGSAFLWHQIRHMVAVLFLVGQRLEDPAVVSELLDTQRTPCRPSYVMAEEVPLVLWDCIFPDLTATEGVGATDQEQEQEQGSSSARIDCMNWIYVGDERTSNKFGQFGLMESTWRLWRGHKMDELLSAQLLQRISQQGRRVHNGTDSDSTGTGTKTERKGKGARTKRDAGPTSSKVFEGGNGGRLGGKYVPVMKKPLLQSVEEQNDRYARRKGFADAADMKARWAESKEAGEMDE
ncbi:hypothetical protein E4U35_006602 [Claviceps purpurea]|nr:hypothetical protein E4U35_006602 [Claviceps purpurea]